MDDFTVIMSRLKVVLNLKSDAELARELGIKTPNFADKKKKKSIPYENIRILCKKNKLSLDFILNNEKNSINLNNYKELLNNSIKNLNEKESKYYYHLVESEKAKKEIYE